MKLIRLKENDFEVMRYFYLDNDIMKMITGYAMSEKEMQERWANILSWDVQKGYGYFAAYDHQELIGIGCLKPFHQDVEVGYMVHKAYWHQGYGTKICQALMKKVMKMDVKKAVAYVDPLNQASQKILMKCGFHIVYQKGDEVFLEKQIKNRITGYTGLYGIVADPIKHSFSPMMHNTAFQTLGIDDVYLAFETPKEKLDDFITSVKTLNIKGFNVSMPYKLTIMNYMDELTDDAKLCQSVNTVKNDHGKLIGHISDGEGFMLSCQEKGWDVKNQKVVVLGAGGAACAIIVALEKYQAREIVVYNRSDKPFIRELNERLKCPVLLKSFSQLDDLKKDLQDAYLLIQTTNVGMIPYENQCLIPESSYLSDGLKVADIIYKPKETKLLQMAKEKGLDYMNGEGMILYQGAVSFEFWTGMKMPIHEVKLALGMEEK